MLNPPGLSGEPQFAPLALKERVAQNDPTGRVATKQ